MTRWQLQEAKARFSELIDDTLEKGPQVITRRGIDTAVVVSIDQWHKLKDENHLTWKEALLGEGRDSKFPTRSVARSNRAGQRSSIDSLGEPLNDSDRPEPRNQPCAWARARVDPEIRSPVVKSVHRFLNYAV
jgi:antitoxin Phd